MDLSSSRRPYIHYAKTDDLGTEKQMSSIDFSQAFKSTQLGTALCYSNPLEQKFMEKKKIAIGIEKRRKGNTIFHHQRVFFMTQVFDKGLNLYKKGSTPPPTDDEQEDQEEQEDENEETVEELETKAGTEHRQSSMVRSHTLADLRGRRDSNLDKRRQSRSLQNLSKNELNLPKMKTSIDMTSQETPKVEPKYTRDEDERIMSQKPVYLKTHGMTRKKKGQKKKPEVDTRVRILPPISMRGFQKKEESVVSEKADVQSVNSDSTAPDFTQVGNFKRTAHSLKNNPSLMFPKVLSLANAYDPVDEEELMRARIKEEEEDAALKHFQKKRKQSMAAITFSKNDEKKKKVLTPPPDDQKTDNVKLVQRLTAYLPEHVVARAQDQIRQISNSEAIYARKKELLQENLDRMKEDNKEDKRWRKLEKALSSTHGIGFKWKKAPHTDRWIQVSD